MFGLRPIISTIVVATAVGVTVSVNPLATAADSTSLEAESMTVSPRSAGQTFGDSNASGGQGLTLRSPATASATVSLPVSARVVVRANGIRTCGGYPVMSLLVDGKTVSSTKVSTSGWTDYPTSVSIAAGAHTIGVQYSNSDRAFFCTRSLMLDKLTVITSAPSTTPTTTTSSTSPTPTTTSTPPTTPPGNSLLFNGDFSTGNFSQWPGVQNMLVNNTGATYDRYPPQPHPASITTDATKGYAARFEVRQGDPGIYGAGGPPRSEVLTAFNVPELGEGHVTRQSFSVKFDPTFPTAASDAVWSLTNQWHAQSDGSPPVQFVVRSNNAWTLRVIKWDKPATSGGTATVQDIWSTPLALGQWHDMEMRTYWSASDDKGFIELWRNGVRQKFSDGSFTYRVRTLTPGGGSNYYKEGLYRADQPATGVVYHTGYRLYEEVPG